MNPEQEIFEQALALPSRQAREGYLLKACGPNQDLRRRVDELLAALDEAGELDFLNTGNRGAEAQTVAGDAPPEEGPGTIIGRYKLLQQIGEGGMGVVRMAEQEEPVRRRVALKIVKLGMDTKSVIARFEAERQALAISVSETGTAKQAGLRGRCGHCDGADPRSDGQHVAGGSRDAGQARGE
jgi:hypothetical protein